MFRLIITLVLITPPVNTSKFSINLNLKPTKFKVGQEFDFDNNDITYVKVGKSKIKITNYLYQWYSPVWSDKITNWKQYEYILKYNKQIYFSPNMKTTPKTLNILNTQNKKGIFFKKGDIIKIKFNGAVSTNKFELGYIYGNTISKSYSTQNGTLEINIPKSDNYYFYLLNLTFDSITVNKKEIQFQMMTRDKVGEVKH